MPKRKKSRNRTWHARPSPHLRAKILAAVRTLLADPDAGLPTAGYAVSLRQLARFFAPSPTAATLRNYLPVLVRDGELVSCGRGFYQSPPFAPTGRPRPAR